MEIEYLIVDPTKNITALVTSSVDNSLQKTIADKIMIENPLVEQVGFIGKKNNQYYLRMAGGEFCGNATMSAGLVFCKDMIDIGESITESIFVSGVEKNVSVKIECLNNILYKGTVEMPNAVKIVNVNLNFENQTYVLPAVYFDGICHLILFGEMSESVAEGAIVKWCNDLNLSALGIMIYDEANNYLKPIVYVKSADTLFWESSCASGTSALGAYMSFVQNKPVKAEIFEPGGSLAVSADYETGSLYLSGNIKILSKNTIII